MKLLFKSRFGRDHLEYAGSFTEGVRLTGLNIGRTFIGVMSVETTPGKVILAGDISTRAAKSVGADDGVGE